MSAEQGGGLAIYETQTLLQGNAQSAFEIATSGESVKTLVPNPMPELAELCAVVTNNGNLLMANFKEKSLVMSPSSNGPVIRSGVTSVGWSTKGKQFVAGLTNGSIVQMTPDGTEKAEIPKPPSLENVQVASIAWLENHLFMAIYNENAGSPPTSQYFSVTRSGPGQPLSFDFRKLQDPITPYGNESAPYHTILRMREYPPAIQELLIIGSSVQDSLGLITKCKAPLATDQPAEDITNVLTTTEFSDDSRRAALPSDEDYNETYPIGLALDLSSKDRVYKPVPADEEIEYSPGPLPAAWALNNQGVLSAWWMVYYDAIRDGTTYAGMATTASKGEPAAQAAAPATVPNTSTFGSRAGGSAFGASSAFGSVAPALSQPSAPSNPFGGAGAASGPTFGAPSFGATSGLGGKPAAPAFGQSGGLGNRASPWATGSTSGGPAFGSHGFSSSAAPIAGGSMGGKVFGSGASSGAAAGGGFASLAGQSGFASFADKKSESVFSKPSSSPFGSTSRQSPFGSGGQSAFGGGNQSQSVFGGNAQKPSSGLFGSKEVSMGDDTASQAPNSAANDGPSFGSSKFELGTTFKADPQSANDNETPSGKGGFSLGGFGLSLDDDASKSADNAETKDENMDTATSAQEEKPKSIFSMSQESTTPTSTPAPSKFFSADSATSSKPNPFGGPPTTSSVFGSTKVQPSAPKAFNPFAQLGDNASKTGQSSSLFGTSSKPNPFALSKSDAATDPPLPPDTTSKSSYPFGESSSSSFASTKTNDDHTANPVDDAPLPPDFIPAAKNKSKPDAGSVPPPLPEEEPVVPEEAPLPPDPTPKSKTEPKPLFQSLAAPEIPESDDDLSEEADSEGEAETEGDEEEEEDAEEAEEGSEGSGVDVAKDLSPSLTGAEGTGPNPGTTPQSSFGGMGASTFSLVSRPDAAQPTRGSLFGEQPRSSVFATGAAALPKPEVTSPHSPSPVRSSVPQRMFPGEGSRSVSAPGLGSSRNQNPSYGKSITSKVQPKEDPNVTLQKEAQKRQAEEEQSLEDEEYERVVALLESPVEPTIDMGEFNAFHSVTADAHAATVAAQVEALYRDMNGMLVTLGLNARALAGFIKGHEEGRKPKDRTQQDLEDPDDWVLCEAEDLGQILDGELAPELEQGRIQDLDDTWDTCQGISRELPKLRAKKQDLKRVLDTLLDPDQAAAARAMPLSAEQTAQQIELRQAYARTTKLMAEAEDALTMLKTKLASVAGKPNAAPTVDAIIRTISKMTSAAEKRSGEIDILESQMRKLRMSGSIGPSPSREGSPSIYRTPPSNKRQSLILAGSGFTPSPLRGLSASVNGSASRGGPSPRKKMTGFTDDDKTAIRDKMQKRQAVLDRLRGRLVENGPKVSRMGER